jgi:hypothetical protein
MMNAIRFDHLQANLSEIYAAAEAAQSQDVALSLYATSPSTVYYQGCWMGQVVKKWDQAWRWMQPTHRLYSVDHALQFILNSLFNQCVRQAYHVRQQRMWNHMRQIDRIWKGQEMTQQRQRYAQFLAKELKGSIENDHSLYLAGFDQWRKEPLKEEEESEQHEAMKNFHYATECFWSLFFIKEDDQRKNIRDVLKRFISSSALTDRPLFKALRKEKMWVQLEGELRQSVPVVLLAKLHDPSQLTVEENQRLTEWVQSLNRCKQSISATLLTAVLTEVVRAIHLQGSSPITWQDIVCWLEQQGCLLLDEEDAAYMDKREKLQPGQMITCNGKKLRLGRQLSPQKEINDRNKVFELVDYPNYVVKIAHNRFRLLIEDRQAQSAKGHWGVRLVKTIANLEKDNQAPAVHGLDKQGRCVVLEKLSTSFASHEWNSQSVKLSPEDEKPALVFANQLFCMKEWKLSVQNLSLSHLMWNREGVLTSTRILKMGPPNYNEWEKHCERATKGNVFVLSFLMHVSKLSEHPIALYYRKCVEETLKTGEINLMGIPLPLGHRQMDYEIRVKSLCEQARQLREECPKYVIAQLRQQNKYSYEQESQVRREIGERLLAFYRVWPTPGRLPSHFQQEVIRSFMEKIPLPKPIDAQGYYREKHELMMEYNKACLRDIL